MHIICCCNSPSHKSNIPNLFLDIFFNNSKFTPDTGECIGKGNRFVVRLLELEDPVTMDAPKKLRPSRSHFPTCALKK